MRPTTEVETQRFSRWSSTTSGSLPTARILLAQGQHARGQLRRPGGLAHAARAMRVLFQCAQIVAVEPPLPAIKCLPADAESTAGPRRISALEVIEQHP